MRPNLTARQVDVLRRLAEGHTNDGIAESLSIAPDTVRSHLQRIFAKLRVHRRADAVAEGRRRGLIDT